MLPSHMAKLLLEIKINCKPTEGIYLIFRTSMTFSLDYCCQHFIEKLLNGKGQSGKETGAKKAAFSLHKEHYLNDYRTQSPILA